MVRMVRMVPSSSLSPIPTHEWIGDWVVTLGKVAAPRRTRGEAPGSELAYELAYTGKDEGRLWTVPSNPSWQGAPFCTWSQTGSQFWLYGETSTAGGTEAGGGPLSTDEESLANTQGGNFLLVRNDGATGEWHVWTQRYGTLHAYWRAQTDGCAIGTFLAGVLPEAGLELDWEALSCFFALGFFAGERTHYCGAHILAPASHYVWDSRGRLVQKRRYWDHWFRPDHQRSASDTTQQFGELLHQVLKEQCSAGKVAVPISGGLDSRSTIAAIPGESWRSRRLLAYSYGYTEASEEIAIARQIARLRALPFRSFVLEPNLLGNLDRAILSTEGFQDLTQCRQLSIPERLEDDADYLIAAHGGDLWLGDMGFAGATHPPSDADILAKALQATLKRGRSWLLKHLCKPRVSEDPESLARAAVQEQLQALANLGDAEHRLKAFKADLWFFRWTAASLRTFQTRLFPRMPFFDYRLLDFLATVPSSFHHRRGLQVEYLKRFAPDLARVVWEAHDTNLYRYRRHGLWGLPKRGLKRVVRSLRFRRPIQRNWELQFLGKVGEARLRERLLGTGQPILDLVDRTQIEALLGDFYRRPQAGSGYTVSMLLTFAAWLRSSSVRGEIST